MECRVRLGDVVKVVKRGVKPEPGIVYRHYSLPAFDNGMRPEEVDGDTIRSSKLVVFPNTILMNKLNVRFKRVWPVLECNDRSIASTEFMPLKVEGADYWYIYYYLISPALTSLIEGMRTGTSGSHQRIDASSFLGIQIDLPSLKNQEAIGRILRAFDEKIELNNRINDYLLELATARFEQELVQNSNTLSFSELVGLEDSKRVPLNSRDRESRKGPYPYYGATSIMDYVDDYLFDGIRVLLGEDGTVIQEDGKPVLQYVWGKYWVNNHAHILKSKSDYSIEAVYIALSRTAINHIVTGAVQKKISQKNLNSLKLEMPEPDSLRYLEDVFTLYRSNTEESRELERLRDALLPKLMSGEIDVSQIDLTQLNNRLSDC